MVYYGPACTLAPPDGKGAGASAAAGLSLLFCCCTVLLQQVHCCAIAPTVSVSLSAAAALAYISPAHTALPPVGIQQVEQQHLLLYPGQVFNMKIANAVSDGCSLPCGVNVTSL